MNHGDVFWVDLPSRRGHEQSGRRPAVIWQDTAAFAGLPTVVVIPLTSRTAALRFPGTVEIQPTAENGLSAVSVALVFQLGACDVRRILNRAGSLCQDDVDQIAAVAKELQKLG